MKRVFEKSLAVAMLVVMVFTINVFAYDTGTGRVKVPKDCKFVTAKTHIERSKKYDYVLVKADSVYPVEEGKEDTYKKCRTRIYFKDTPISDTKVLEENNLTHVKIYNGHLNHSMFNLRFAGNNPDLGARINYYYNGK